MTSRRSRRARAGRALASLLALAAAACEFLTGDRSARDRRDALTREPYAAHLMPPEVGGVALGQDWQTLRTSRPAVTHDSFFGAHGGPLQHWVSEHNASAHVMYYFSERARPDTAGGGPSATTRLSAVEVSLTGVLRSDTAEYRRVVAGRSARWDSLLGPADSVDICWPEMPGAEPWEWRRWFGPDVTLLLGSTPDEYLTPEPVRDSLWDSRPATQQRRSVMLVVQSARLAHGAGLSGYIRSFSRCGAG